MIDDGLVGRPLDDREQELLAAMDAPERNEAFDGGVDALVEEPAAEVTLVPVAPLRTKRRVVTKVEQKHLAQEMLMHGIGNVLGYWHEDLGNQKKLAELGIDQEKFGEILLAQADRVAKALGFEQAWSN